MKLEFLAEGSQDCPLVRLYEFDLAEAMRLREAFRSLADGSRRNIPLHEEWWIEPLADCQLDLRLGPRDLGVVQRLPLKFECALTAQTWVDIVSLVDPFCMTETLKLRQWLNKDGEISLLLSPDGQW